MACFIVPSILALIVSVARRLFRSIGERVNLGLLEAMLWGGAGLLALEHLWHGELVPWPPFLTAMKSPEDWAVALHEMSTAGVAMSIAVAAAWGGVVLFQRHLAVRPERIERITGVLKEQGKGL
ncbi:hypothetical protein ACSU1N_06720 [Thermogladius sp. 4427co]|uniref:hypothetical protein n=1 Tax=Thermogladius sp. 4427co TaxID=3450718 RepID=UPI003F7B12B0